MEVHAVQLGNAWQLETWLPADTFKIAVRTNDAAIMKRVQQELARLHSELPALELFERHARGTYLVLRNKFEQAIPLLDTDEEPASRAGWARTRGLLARAYNGLGQHERARAICADALQYLSPDDRLYVVSNLSVQIELPLSELGLGHVSTAKEQLDALLLLHAPNQSAVTLGSLHDARARVALAEHAFAEAREHLAQMETHYRTTGIATLIELVGALRRDIDRVENPRDAVAERKELRERTEHVMLRVQLMLSQHGSAVAVERAQKGLQVALELSSADEGFLLMAHGGSEPIAHLGRTQPSRELIAWAQQSMLDAAEDEATVMTEDTPSVVDTSYKLVEQTRYGVVPLWAKFGGEERVVAALVLGFDNQIPRMPEPAVMHAIAMHLAGAPSA
jgi:tetratricopeptide (TPR) repeat protein